MTSLLESLSCANPYPSPYRKYARSRRGLDHYPRWERREQRPTRRLLVAVDECSPMAQRLGEENAARDSPNREEGANCERSVLLRTRRGIRHVPHPAPYHEGPFERHRRGDRCHRRRRGVEPLSARHGCHSTTTHSVSHSAFSSISASRSSSPRR